MHEFDPEGLELIESRADTMLRVSGQAGHGLSSEVKHNPDATTRIADAIEEMEVCYPEMHNLMTMLTYSWNIPDKHVNQFVDGYTTAYKLLSYQAELSNDVVTDITEGLSEGYRASLYNYDSHQYVKRVMGELKSAKNPLPKYLDEYTSSFTHMNENDKHAFELGAVSAYDIIYEQAKLDDITANYQLRTPEEKVENMSAAMLARIISRI